MYSKLNFFFTITSFERTLTELDKFSTQIDKIQIEFGLEASPNRLRGQLQVLQLPHSAETVCCTLPLLHATT